MNVFHDVGLGIRFNNERITYLARNLELIGGVECPETAKFFDAVHFVDSNNPKTIKSAMCVFELDSGIPLRCHFQTDDGKGYKF